MRLLIKIRVLLTLVCVSFAMPLFSSEAESQLNIIERTNFQKMISVKNLTDISVGKLKNYITFSFHVSDKLIFCHISKDGSEPRVICH